MKDAEFIELLNLYLDHEITPADAARLEAEVLGNPARRQIYREYCRMQKGCKLLAKEFAGDASALAQDEGKVVAFESARARSRRAGLYVASGFAAAAACVAFIFQSGSRTEPGRVEEMPAVVQSSLPAPDDAIAVASAPRTIGPTVTVPETREARPVLVNALTLAGNSNPAQPSLLATAEQSAPQFDWMHNMKLPPLERVSVEEFRFDSRAPLRAESQPYTAPRAQQGRVEWNAIRYSK